MEAETLDGMPFTGTSDPRDMEMNEYDRVRVPCKAHDAKSQPIRMSVRTLQNELVCPICLDLLTECLHRFCNECITTALQRGNKECPTCRKKLVSRRSLRPDPNFDRLIEKIWPDRKIYELMQTKSLELLTQQSNFNALRQSISDGMKEQAASRRQRVAGSYDVEEPTPARRRRRKKKDHDDDDDEEAHSSGGGYLDDELCIPDNPMHEEKKVYTEKDLRYFQRVAKIMKLDEVPYNIDAEGFDHDLYSSASTYTTSASSSLPIDDRQHFRICCLESNGKDMPGKYMKTMAPRSSPSPQPLPPRLDIAKNQGSLDLLELEKSFPVQPWTMTERLNFWFTRWGDGSQADSANEMNEPRYIPVEDRLEIRPGDVVWMELEFLPAVSLLKSSVKHFKTYHVPRYIRTQHSTTFGHLSAFLFELIKRDAAEFNENRSQNDLQPPQQFYLFSSIGGHHVHALFMNETVADAQALSSKNDHIMVFYDIQPPQISAEQRSLLDYVVPESFLRQKPSLPATL